MAFSHAGRQCAEIASSRWNRANSVRVEDRLILRDLLANGSRFCRRRLIWIGRRRQGTEFHQARHQQEPRLCRGEVRAANEGRVVQWHKALGVAASDANDWKPAVYRSEQKPVPCV